MPRAQTWRPLREFAASFARQRPTPPLSWEQKALGLGKIALLKTALRVLGCCSKPHPRHRRMPPLQMPPAAVWSRRPGRAISLLRSVHFWAFPLVLSRARASPSVPSLFLAAPYSFLFPFLFLGALAPIPCFRRWLRYMRPAKIARVPLWNYFAGPREQSVRICLRF